MDENLPTEPSKKKPRFPGAVMLQRTFISEGIEPVIPDNYVVQDSHIKQQAAIFDLFGNFIVGFAWCDCPRGVVMTQDDRGCMLFQANLKDFFRINNGPGYSTFGYFDFLNDPVCSVQQQKPEFFIRKVAHQGMKNFKGILAL